MRLRPSQLADALRRGLTSIYAVCGDEPLLVDEAAAEVRAAARRAGYGERRSFQVDSGFSWGGWRGEFESLSLFAERRLVELHLPGGKPGVEGGRSLENWCAAPPADTLLLVILPRADRAMQQSKWYGALERAGAVVQVTPPTPAQLPAWIGARLAKHGLKAETETLAFLAARVEGNLLAAHQEIEKLALLCPPGPLDREAARNAVVDVSRHDAGDLAEAFMRGDAPRYCRIIDGLEAEGETPLLANWLMAQELRSLLRLARGLESGGTLPALMREAGVWESRQALVAGALDRLPAGRLALALRQAAAVDRASKGLLADQPWAMLKLLGLGLMGKSNLKNEFDYGY